MRSDIRAARKRIFLREKLIRVQQNKRRYLRLSSLPPALTWTAESEEQP